MITDELSQLAALCKRHIEEEFSSDAHLFSDPEHCAFFKPKTAVAPQEKKQAPAIKAPAPPPPKAAAPQPKKPEPVAPVKKEEEVIKPVFQKQATDFSAIRALLPLGIKIIEEIPSDEEARRINSASDHPEVVIIAIDTPKEHLELLQKIAGAIFTLGHSAKVLEGSINWDKVINSSLLILMPEELLRIPLLAGTYRKEEDLHFLGKAKVCPLLPIKTYIEQPKEKARLWAAIRAILQ